MHWPDYVVLAALLVTLVISETIPPVTRRIYHVGPDGAASALETWQCASLLYTLNNTSSMHTCIGSPTQLHPLFKFSCMIAWESTDMCQHQSIM